MSLEADLTTLLSKPAQLAVLKWNLLTLMVSQVYLEENS